MARGARENDWFAVGAYALLAGTSQLLWLTFAPITTESAAHFGVSEDAVGWLAEIFPLLYVVLAIPAGLLLDRWLRQTLWAAGALMLAGASIRLASADYAAALAGQLLIAVAQPAVLAAITKVATERITPAARPTAIAVGSAGTFLGLVGALVLGATVGARDDLAPLLWINFAVAAVALVSVIVVFRAPSAAEEEESVALSVADLKSIYSDPLLRRLGAMIFIGMGVFNAVATWLEVLLQPEGIGSDATSWILTSMAVAGIVGAVLIAPRVSARRTESQYLQLAAAVGAAVFLAMVPVGSALPAAVLLSLLGLLLLGAQPVILELTERRAGHAAASAAGAIFLAGNLGGIVLAVVVQSVNDSPTAAFFVLAVAMAVIAPIARSLQRNDAY